MTRNKINLAELLHRWNETMDASVTLAHREIRLEVSSLHLQYRLMCSHQGRAPKVCYTAGKERIQKKGKGITRSVPDDRFGLERSVREGQMNPGRNISWCMMADGIPHPSSKWTLPGGGGTTHCYQERVTWFTSTTKEMWKPNTQKTPQENKNIYVISYRGVFWACFVMINPIFLVQGRS